MVKFSSLKSTLLLGIGLLCFCGAGLLVNMDGGEGPAAVSAQENRRVEALAREMGELDARVLKLEALFAEGKGAGHGEMDSLSRELRELQSRTRGLVKRLDLHEKKVDKPGQKTDKVAKVGKEASSRRSPAKSFPVYHVVRSGETLYRISKKYHISERDLIRLNGLNDKTRILVGQRLRVAP